MVFKPNYNQQRAERNRAKQAKQEAKQEAKREQRRQTEAGEDGAAAPPTDDSPGGESDKQTV